MTNIGLRQPVFNFLHITDEGSCPKMNTKIQLMYIQDMKKRDNMMMFTQMCDNGNRMCRENKDYNYWNQCVFEDIDYKRYIESHKEFIDPETLYELLYEWLYNNYRDILYYTEMSRSKRGYHIIFSFNVQRNCNNRMMCKALSNFIIHKAFNELGYRYIIEYPKVYDDCSDSFYQPCFLTLNNYKINNEWTGDNTEKYMTDNYYSIKSIYDKLFSKSVNIVKKKDKNSVLDDEYNGKWNIEFTNDNTIYNGEYLNHHERYFLYRSIVGLCGGIEYIDENEDIIRQEWENCAEQLPEGHGHTTYFYIREPHSDKWNDWIKHNETYCYIDEDLLKQFGYTIKYINNKKNENTVKERTSKIKKEKVYL